MARINRTDVIQKAVSDLAISTSTDKVPTETLDKVQLTYNLNRNFSSFLSGGNANATGSLSVTLPTVSSGAETYITSIQVSLIKDATCDQATGAMAVNFTPDQSGVATNAVVIPIITLTAQSHDIVINLDYPLKVKNASNITFTASYTVGVMSRAVRVIGFTTSSN